MTEDLFGDSLRDEIDDLVEVLWLMPGWPRDVTKDRALIAELRRQFPEKDLADELGQWRVWMIAKGTKEMVTSNGRWSRVRNWCAGRFVGASRTPASQGRGRGRARTAARPAAAFGESSTALSRW